MDAAPILAEHRLKPFEVVRVRGDDGLRLGAEDTR
jgi:hypothetical protein